MIPIPLLGLVFAAVQKRILKKTADKVIEKLTEIEEQHEQEDQEDRDEDENV